MRNALVLLAAVLLCRTGLSAAEPAYRFGVVPEMKREKLVEQWTPLLEALSKEAGVKLVFDTSKDISSFYAKFHDGGYDFALVNPSEFVKAKKGVYHAFARQDATLQGILVVRANSKYDSLASLFGKTVAFPSKESYAATVLLRQDLERAGLDGDKGYRALYTGGHDKSYAAVLMGEAEAAGGVMRTFTQLKPGVAAQLRVLHTTKPSIPHPFVASAKVPAAVVARVQQALVMLSGKPEGVALLRAFGMRRIIKAEDADWDSLSK